MARSEASSSSKKQQRQRGVDFKGLLRLSNNLGPFTFSIEKKTLISISVLSISIFQHKMVHPLRLACTRSAGMLEDDYAPLQRYQKALAEGIHDGVGMISISIDPGFPLLAEVDQHNVIATGSFHVVAKGITVVCVDGDDGLQLTQCRKVHHASCSKTSSKWMQTSPIDGN